MNQTHWHYVETHKRTLWERYVSPRFFSKDAAIDGMESFLTTGAYDVSVQECTGLTREECLTQ